MFLPDMLGRKGTMNIFVPLYIISSYLSTYSHSLLLLKIGFFFNGFLHLKGTLCYTHGVELIPDKYKALIPTLINFYDCASTLILALFFKFIDPDVDKILHILYIIGWVASILYLIIIPESPKWLIIREGPRSKQAIKILNYIAWFNGSTYRVPSNTKIDLLEKVA